MMQCACGCTDKRACEGGCFWVYRDPATGKGLCSKCVFEDIYRAAAGAPEDVRFDIGEKLIELANRIHPEHDGNVAAFEEAQEAIEGMGVGGFDPSTGLRDDDAIYRPLPRVWRPGDPI